MRERDRQRQKRGLFAGGVFISGDEARQGSVLMLNRQSDACGAPQLFLWRL